VPGIGTILSLVWLDDIHQLERFPRVQDFASSGRLVTCAKASGGKRVGTAGNKLGNAHRKWAFSEAATLCLRGHEPGQNYLARLEKQHDQGKALRILAHKRARAVSCMRKRKTAVALEPCLRTYGSRAGAPGASLDTDGMSLNRTDVKPMIAASLNAAVRLGPLSLSPAR
jgi:Transposase IS116/IS110/IS902 family